MVVGVDSIIDARILESNERSFTNVTVFGSTLEISAPLTSGPPKLLEIAVFCSNSSWFRFGVVSPQTICQGVEPLLPNTQNPLQMRFDGSILLATLRNVGTASSYFSISVKCAHWNSEKTKSCLLPPLQLCHLDFELAIKHPLCVVEALVMNTSPCWSLKQKRIIAQISIPKEPVAETSSLPYTVKLLLIVVLSLLGALIVIAVVLWILNHAQSAIRRKRESDYKRFASRFYEQKINRKSITNEFFKSNENEGEAF